MKAVYATKSEIPEAFVGEYEERNGAFHLKVEGDYAPLIEANTKLAEFRDNNRTLNAKANELTEKLKKYGEVTPESVIELQTKLKEFEKKGAGKPDDLTKMISDAVKAATEPLTTQLTEIKQREAFAQTQLREKGLEDAIRSVGTKLGVRENAMPDFISRGRSVFKVDEEGRHTAMDGKTPIFSKARPADPLTMEEWGMGLKQGEGSHLFEGSKGGGTPPAGSPQVFAPKTMISADPMEFGRNLEKIAKGEVGVLVP